MTWIVFLFVLVIIFKIVADKAKYEKSTYKKETQFSYWKVKRDKGLNGEYLTVNEIDQLKGFHKVLVNLYLPKARGGGTTEIDIVLLHETGIYTIESKNYGGWIFGNEEYKNWTQTFPNGRKQVFYNPIKQNRTHIHALKKQLNVLDGGIFKSIIVFSERCELKDIVLTSTDSRVIKRKRLRQVIHNEGTQVLSGSQILSIYKQLKEFSNVSQAVKVAHIAQVKKRQR
ncbi:nuclease-related domain-containing protein [Peribacillus sp. NPDC097675]|uniref:nuclease-related domain-containing protein n=1 Tax=Peribacillus sp. NPDC097675 TaxID=3390618 RepID=UPI003CFEB05B